jgi:hypothetical protein
MTRDKDRKRIIRTRMQKTGESYTAARLQVISAAKKSRTQATLPVEPPVNYASLAGMREEAIAAKTGHTWREWVRLLDGENAAAMPHREIASLVRSKYGVGDWWSQSVTVGYERIKGLRERGQRRGGSYEVNKTKTVSVPVRALFEAWSDDATRKRWLNGVKAVVRTARAPKSMRLQWPDGTLVVVLFMPKGAAKSSVAVQHTKLADKEVAGEVKQFWADRLETLASVLAGGR